MTPAIVTEIVVFAAGTVLGIAIDAIFSVKTRKKLRKAHDEELLNTVEQLERKAQQMHSDGWNEGWDTRSTNTWGQ